MRLLVSERCQNAEVEHHAAVGIEGNDPPVRQTHREPECLRRHAPELLLEQARAAHVRRGVVPFVDARAEGENHQLVLEAGGEPLHAFEAVHRTTLPASTTAE